MTSKTFPIVLFSLSSLSGDQSSDVRRLEENVVCSIVSSLPIRFVILALLFVASLLKSVFTRSIF
jgi:hypothetical protein